MAYDYNELTVKNCPHRWARVAKHLEENDTAQLNALDTNYKETLQHVYNADFTEIHIPEVPTSLAAADLTGGDANISWDVVADADSYIIYWLVSVGSETAAQIIATPDGSVNGTTPGGTTVATTAGTVRFTITATDVNGTSAGAPVVVQTRT